jgi:enoyl-CoA hydratase/carnithine racemase
MDQVVNAWRDGRIGRIQLNRPAALNALDLTMVNLVHIAMDDFAADPTVHAVVVEAAGNRAFCAGGDVRAIRSQGLNGETQPILEFFTAEYSMNQAIASYPKPFVALIDGLCLGGGIGISVHGSHRIATEHAAFAMPETAIALFPDIGATFFLPRLPGQLGMYYALTGARCAGADAVHAGLATHFVPREHLPTLSAAIAQDGVAVIAGFAQPLPPFSLAPHRALIDHAFGADSVLGIIQRLEADGGEFATATLMTLRGVSPSSVHWSFQILRDGALKTLPQCLAAELALVQKVTLHPEFHEGVRSVVVDKDRSPRWRPARLEEVDPAAIAALFS